MNRKRWTNVLTAVVLGGGVLMMATPTLARDTNSNAINPVAAPDSGGLAASKALHTGAAGVIVRSGTPVSFWSDIIPEISESKLTWVAIVVILVLTIQTRPLRSWRNVDGLALALTAFLLPLRANLGVLGFDKTGHTVQWWAYLLLTVVGIYWLLRGVRILLHRKERTLTPNVSEGAMVVLIIAGLCLAINTIATAPVSAGSRDGLIGGICFADTGKLPYGQAAGHDARSPLLYILHGGAVKLDAPTYVPSVEPALMTWGDRDQWLGDDAWPQVDKRAIRLTNGALFILFIMALAGIGHRLHSRVVGQVLIAIACVFPGTLECLARPEIMLPATLIAWSLMLAAVPRVGGLLSMLVIVLAGFASAWVWLALPVLFAYFLRQGWQGFGATVGLLAGAAAALFGVLTFVNPTLPRDTGALAAGAATPQYQARMSDDHAIIIDNYDSNSAGDSGAKPRLWRFLLARDRTSLGDAKLSVAAPSGVDPATIPFVDILAAGRSRRALQHSYQTALVHEPRSTRLWASLRTLLEETWKPAIMPATSALGAWQFWTSIGSQQSDRWMLIRRISKAVAGVLALLVALLLVRGKRPVVHELYGGLLIVFAATQLVRWPGAASDWVWLLPALLAALAAKGANAVVDAAPPPMGRLPQVGQSAPLITVKDEPGR